MKSVLFFLVIETYDSRCQSRSFTIGEGVNRGSEDFSTISALRSSKKGDLSTSKGKVT